jgi:hypothetical protein
MDRTFHHCLKRGVKEPRLDAQQLVIKHGLATQADSRKPIVMHVCMAMVDAYIVVAARQQPLEGEGLQYSNNKTTMAAVGSPFVPLCRPFSCVHGQRNSPACGTIGNIRMPKNCNALSFGMVRGPRPKHHATICDLYSWDMGALDTLCVTVTCLQFRTPRVLNCHEPWQQCHVSLFLATVTGPFFHAMSLPSSHTYPPS